jgi:hypothetical protein
MRALPEDLATGTNQSTPVVVTDSFGIPGQPQFKQLIVNGIKSAMGLVPFCAGRGHGWD